MTLQQNLNYWNVYLKLFQNIILPFKLNNTDLSLWGKVKTIFYVIWFGSQKSIFLALSNHSEMEQLQTLPYQRTPLISATEQQREVFPLQLMCVGGSSDFQISNLKDTGII